MTEGRIDIAHLRRWIGHTETAEDVVDPSHAAAVAATLDDDWLPTVGDALPPLWHWAFFRPAVAQSGLGPDGHPQLGGFMPPVPLPRRMWVGGRLTFHAPLLIGEPVRRVTRIADITAKSGRNGDLVFITLLHEVTSRHGLTITEEQDLVYRPASAAEAPVSAPAAPQEPAADWRERMQADPVLLFRYSAVTFNSHRIHYDETYAQQEEGYPGLVVHGPLTATLLAKKLTGQGRGRMTGFSFRARQPLFCNRPMAICGRAAPEAGQFTLWAETETGAVAMSASASLEVLG